MVCAEIKNGEIMHTTTDFQGVHFTRDVRDSDVSSEPFDDGSGRRDRLAGPGVAGDVTDSIPLRAYQRYRERGREHGRDLEDWIEAERDVAKEDPE
jgi:hypothetical protein